MKRSISLVLLAIFFLGAWIPVYPYAAKVTAKANPTTGGDVYVSSTTTKSSVDNATQSNMSLTKTFTFYLWTDVHPGYKFTGWTTTDKITFQDENGTTKTSGSRISVDGAAIYTAQFTATANFLPAKVTAIDNTEIKIYSDDNTKNIDGDIRFTTQNANSLDDFTRAKNQTPDKGTLIDSWSLSPIDDIVTLHFSFNGKGSYGGTERENKITYSLTSKATVDDKTLTKDDASKTCTVYIIFPNVEFGDDKYTESIFTQYEEGVDQSLIPGEAWFDVKYVDGVDNFETPTIDYSGFEHFKLRNDGDNGTCMHYDDDNNRVYVYYSYDGNNTEGIHEAELKLKIKNEIGGTENSITLHAENEKKATNDISVTADGKTNDYLWTEGIAEAIKYDGTVVTLLRDVELNTATTVTITKNMIIDLNGHTLTAVMPTATITRFIHVDADNKTLTIKDGKEGGKIAITTAVNNVQYAIEVNKGNLILESGTIDITNNTTGNNDIRYAVGIYQAASTTVTINGGKVNATKTTNRNAYGIYSFGELNINGGEITAKTLGAANAYGVYMQVSQNATAANCTHSTLNMTGGTINAIAQTSSAYGIYSNAAQTRATSDQGADGSFTNKAAAVLNITGGTINATTNTNTTAVGVLIKGNYNSNTNSYHTDLIKNTTINANAATGTAYGVQLQCTADASTGGLLQGDVELTNCKVSAKTVTSGNTARAVLVEVKSTTGTTANLNSGVKYATAAKATINGGTYIAQTKGNTAYTIESSNRAKVAYSNTSEYHAEDYPEAYPILIINGGTFDAKTEGNDARVIQSGGITTINGGTFNAYSETNKAYGFYANCGKLSATNAVVISSASATTEIGSAEAIGAYAHAESKSAAPDDPTAFSYVAELELINCNVTATARKGSIARGVYVYRATGTLKGLVIAAKAKIDGGQYTVTAQYTTAEGVRTEGQAIYYGIEGGHVVAPPVVDIKNATFIVSALNSPVTTNSETYGVRTYGETTIDGCNFKVTGGGNNTFGARLHDGKTSITNTKFTVTGLASSYGIYCDSYVYATCGYMGGEVILNDGNVVTTNTSTGNTSYAIYLGTSSGSNTTAGSEFYGDYANAAKMIINGGTYKATASGTTAYAIRSAERVSKGEASAFPKCIVYDGKFSGYAAGGTYADVSLDGEPGYIILNGGYYVNDHNLAPKLGDGMNVMPVEDGTKEKTDGYNWHITNKMTGQNVCDVYHYYTSGRTEQNELVGSYPSLEEAIDYVTAADQNWILTIVMKASYTLKKREGQDKTTYVLPSNTTLLIPHNSNQIAAYKSSPSWQDKNSVENTTASNPPRSYIKLTFDTGVNMVVQGAIEASSYLNINQNTWTGIPGTSYGWLYLEEGAHIELEDKSALYAWGYVTGKGDINAKRGSVVYEDFQMGDWLGGTNEIAIQGNTNGVNGKGVFLITEYYIQNVECATTYRPGSQLIGYTGCYLEKDIPLFGLQTVQAKSKPITIIGTKDALFTMGEPTSGNASWVKKEYDAINDRQIWTLNSNASMSSFQLQLNMEGGSRVLEWLGVTDININTKDYVLPMASNFTIVANEGDVYLGTDICFAPGSEIVVKKEATLIINEGQNVFFYDSNDWNPLLNYYFRKIGFSPSWKTCPRYAAATTTRLPDAKALVEGTVNVKGKLWTTEHGANIYSTRTNGGTILFNAAAPQSIAAPTDTIKDNESGKTLCQLVKPASTPYYLGKEIHSAYLMNEENEDESYSKTESTTIGETWVYMLGDGDKYRWTKMSSDGCFTVTSDKKHYYVNPSDFVEINDNMNADGTYSQKGGERVFINTEAPTNDASCLWWDVDPVPNTEIKPGQNCYRANKTQFDNYNTYYYYDYGIWKPVTIKIEFHADGKKLENDTYGDEYAYNSTPIYYGSTPTRQSDDLNTYSWEFAGWYTIEETAEGSETTTYYPIDGLLPATKPTTYHAHFKKIDKVFSIVCINYDDKSTLYANSQVPKGTKEEDLRKMIDEYGNFQKPSAGYVYTFNRFEPELQDVESSMKYTAYYDQTKRKYIVDFVNIDGTLLQRQEIEYESKPEYDYSGGDPYYQGSPAFSYEFTGWKSSAGEYVKGAELDDVYGDITYIAQYETTDVMYHVLFKTYEDKDNYQKQYKYGVMPAYKEDDDAKPQDYIDDDAIVIFTGWDKEIVPATENTTYTALYYKHSNYVLDIVDWESNNGTPTAIIINPQNFASSGWPYTISIISINGNYKQPYGKDARNDNRTLTLSLADFGLTNTKKDDKLTIEIRNKDNNLVGGHYTYVPYIFDGDGTYTNVSSNSIVYVHSGELKITGNAQANTIYVSPQAQLTIPERATLTVGNLLLRTTPSAAAVLDIKGTLDIRDKKDIIYYTRILDNEGGASQYYQLGLPLSVNIDDVSLSLGTKPEYNATWLLKYYDTQERAKNGTNGKNWVAVTDGQIKAGVGYEMFSLNNYYTEYYFPVRLTNLTNEINVQYAYDPTTGDNHAGWNVISSPLLNAYSNEPVNDPTTVLKFSRLTADGIVEQEAPEHIMPAIVYSYQAAQDETSIIFNSSSAAGIAPRWQTADEVMTQTEWLPIRITNNDKQRDEVSFFVHPTRFGDGYEIGIDVAKQSLTANRPLIYSSMPYGDMAFAGVSDDDMMAGVALTTYSPNKQQVTFSLRDNKFLDRLANVYLKDTYAGSMTDLLMFNYTTSLYAGTTQDRFYIMAIFKSQVNTTPTDINGVDNLDLVVWSVQKQIYVNTTDIGSTIYCFDATGRLVDSKLVTEKTVVFNVPTAGVYIIKSADKVKRTIAY